MYSLRKMELFYYLLFYMLHISFVCNAQVESCQRSNMTAGEINNTVSDIADYRKCWVIGVPEDSYVHLNLSIMSFQSLSCSEAYIQITVIGTKEEYMFCSQDTNRKPVTALNDVNITHYYSKTGNFFFQPPSSSFRLFYKIESIICAEKNHFRCSDHHCIHESQVCNGVKDCENGSDEASCETGVTAIKGVNVSLENAVFWLKSQRSSSFGWGKNTHRALTALYLAGSVTFEGVDLEEDLMTKQLQLQAAVALLRNSSDPLTVNELSMYINALFVTCHNPRQFYGNDILQILSERMARLESPSPGAYMTLCNANWTFSESQVRTILNILNEHSGYPFQLDIQAMIVMALTCIKNKSKSFYDVHNAYQEYNDTIQKFIAHQQDDGSFGNIYTTALVTQALLSSGQEDNKAWNLTLTVKYLMKKLNSSSIDFLSIYFTLPILNGKSLVDLAAVNCNNQRKEGKEDEISDVINKLGGKMQVKYSLYIGDEKDVIHSIYLRMPVNSSAYDVMRVAQVADPKYKFLQIDAFGYMYVYKIAGIINDPEDGKFWLLYAGNFSANGTVQHYTESPDKFFLSTQDHLVMWYKTIHI